MAAIFDPNRKLSIAKDIKGAKKIQSTYYPLVKEQLRNLRLNRQNTNTRKQEIFHRSYQDIIRSVCVLGRSLQSMYTLQASKHTPDDLRALVSNQNLAGIKKALHQSELALKPFNSAYQVAA